MTPRFSIGPINVCARLIINSKLAGNLHTREQKNEDNNRGPNFREKFLYVQHTFERLRSCAKNVNLLLSGRCRLKFERSLKHQQVPFSSILPALFNKNANEGGVYLIYGNLLKFD